MPASKLKLFKHQKASLRVYARTPIVFDTSDPGTGKTPVALKAWARRKGGRMLVVCVKSNVETVWCDEAAVWTPEASIATALAPDRYSAFRNGADIVVINTDGVKWIAANSPSRLLRGFDTLVVDESSYFKHRTSTRSESLLRIRKYFEYIAFLSGTPHSNSILDLWHQMMVLDKGERLGNHFFKFRNVIAEKEQIGPRPEHVKWVDRPGSVEAVYSLIKDISIRHEFDACMDVPPMSTNTKQYRLPPKVMAQYEHLKRACILQLENAAVVGVNAASLRSKLLQLCSGAVYANGDRSYELIDSGRYELIADLIEERPHSVVFFNWRHQREELIKHLARRKLAAGYIDGSVKQSARGPMVRKFQDGGYRALLLHPRTGAHGLTLTKGTSVIWCSPIYEPDLMRQGIHRIRRGTQTKRTECVLVEARGTVERIVYELLNSKDAHMMELLDLLKET